MAKSSKKIEGTESAWEQGSLGADETYAQVSTLIDQEALDEALELQPISIRIQKGLLEDLKLIAELHGMGYQPLIKNLLQRFVVSEQKRFYREHASAMLKERKGPAKASGPDGEDDAPEPEARRA